MGGGGGRKELIVTSQKSPNSLVSLVISQSELCGASEPNSQSKEEGVKGAAVVEVRSGRRAQSEEDRLTKSPHHVGPAGRRTSAFKYYSVSSWKQFPAR